MIFLQSSHYISNNNFFSASLMLAGHGIRHENNLLQQSPKDLPPKKNNLTWIHAEEVYWFDENKNIHCVSKMHHFVTVHYLCQMLTDFQNSFTGTFSIQFAITRLQNIPPHLKCVATLLCKI